jgi:RNase H-fold protein (predicted Holliday junction resolvase)
MMVEKQDNKYFLGIDWGESRCGLALADEENKIASGLEDVKRNDLRDKVFSLKKRFQIEGVIIGKVDSKRFDQDIKILEALDLKVSLENEKFSTLLAQKNLAEANKKRISKNDNIESARIILQAWLDR